MEELRQTALTYYNSFPGIRAKVNKLFDTMDVNKDGTISFFEFSSFMSKEGYNLFNNPSFFNEISTEMTYDFNKEDVITLFYIIESDRPFCDGCRRIIKGLYFTCRTCFEENGSCFYLHQECLAQKRFIHKHADFLDNFALLHFIRKKRLADMKPAGETDLLQNFSSSSSFQEIQNETNLFQNFSSSSSFLEIENVGNPSVNDQLALILTILEQQNQQMKRERERERKSTFYKALAPIASGITTVTIASIAACTIM